MKLRYLVPLILVLFLSSLPIVFAQDEEQVNMLGFPEYLAARLGIPLFAGQILASLIVMGLFIFPTLFFVKKFDVSIYAVLVMGFVSMGFCVAVTWLPWWFLLVICMIVSLMFAGEMRDLITGRNR